jgi:hypothetical protein
MLKDLYVFIYGMARFLDFNPEARGSPARTKTYGVSRRSHRTYWDKSIFGIASRYGAKYELTYLP